MGEHGFNHNPHLTLHAHVQQAVHETESPDVGGEHGVLDLTGPAADDGAILDDVTENGGDINGINKAVKIVRKPISELADRGVGVVGPTGGGILVRRPAGGGNGLKIGDNRPPSITLEDEENRFSDNDDGPFPPFANAVRTPKPLTNVQGFLVTQSVPKNEVISNKKYFKKLVFKQISNS